MHKVKSILKCIQKLLSSAASSLLLLSLPHICWVQQNLVSRQDHRGQRRLTPAPPVGGKREDKKQPFFTH